MAEKLLLHMEYELVKNRVNIPWDSIAHRLSKSSTHSWSVEVGSSATSWPRSIEQEPADLEQTPARLAPPSHSTFTACASTCWPRAT